jgi:copper chaperone CopZ
MSATDAETPLLADHKAVAEVQLVVGGLSCGRCDARVRKALEALDGVESADVSHETRAARVRYRHALVSPERIVACVVGAGYSASVAPTAALGLASKVACTPSMSTASVEGALRSERRAPPAAKRRPRSENRRAAAARRPSTSA